MTGLWGAEDHIFVQVELGLRIVAVLLCLGGCLLRFYCTVIVVCSFDRFAEFYLAVLLEVQRKRKPAAVRAVQVCSTLPHWWFWW